MPTKTKTPEPNKPVSVFRARGVKVSVFENHADNGTFYKTTILRIYKQGEEWKTTSSLSRDDLPIAQYLLHKAWSWILKTENPDKETDE